MAAIARRTFAAVILKGAPPLRPRARADARPALVRSEIRSRSNSAFCRELQKAEVERNLIRERTLAGLKAARARGRNGGRPKKLSPKELKTIRTLLRSNEVPVQDIAAQFKVNRSTLYRNVTAVPVM